MQPLEFYTDFRQFLADFYEYKKRCSETFSYRQFCQKAGLKSPSIFREVVAGKRNLTYATIDAFIRGLGLSERDGRFFTNLVRFNQAKNEETKRKYLAMLRGLRYRKPQKQIPIHIYEYYERWYNPVIREMAVAIDWREDYAFLAKSLNPPIKVSEARDSVNLLLRLGFLVKKEDGTYAQSSQDITTGPEVNSLAVRQINREYARLGLEAIDRFPPEVRDISSVIMSIPHEKLKELKREIEFFRKRIIHLAEDEGKKTDSFYSLVVELFPVGQKNEMQGFDNGKQKR